MTTVGQSVQIRPSRGQGYTQTRVNTHTHVHPHIHMLTSTEYLAVEKRPELLQNFALNIYDVAPYEL